MKISSLFLLLLFAFIPTLAGAQTCGVEKINGQWTLTVDGVPFKVRGVTFGYADDPEHFETYFQDLQFLGVNAIRLWGANEHTGKLLDVAQAHGIRVMVGIWMRHGRPGMEDDDRFNYLEDQEGMEKMYTDASETVKQYKDHPAVLCWGVGNEVYLNTATDAEKEAYSRLLERICSNIKKLDPHHPIASVEAWTFGLDWWSRYVPSIDIYGINCYGPGADILPSELAKRGLDKPYLITEFGVTGEWDIKQKNKGVLVEPNDRQKYEAITQGYPRWIKSKPACLGAFIFHYGNGNDFGSGWLLTHYRQSYRPQYWAIREAYTGQKPLNLTPVIEAFSLPDGQIKSGTWVPVQLSVRDPEGEELEIDFFYNQRSGSRKRRNQISPLASRGNRKDGFEIQLPPEDGAIKVYVNVRDAYNNLGMASTPIEVLDKKASLRKYLVPKADLPFHVYREGEKLPYIPSGHMGNIDQISVDLKNKEEVHADEFSVKISYSARDDWYGIGFVDPPNDWGDILGGYDLSGATKFSFWAKASDSNVQATIGFGLIDGDKPFPDTAKRSKTIKLSTKWKKYSIRTKGLDLSCIRSGLVVFSQGNGFPHAIYLDEVVFE